MLNMRFIFETGKIMGRKLNTIDKWVRKRKEWVYRISEV
jgi:hypothetical protein